MRRYWNQKASWRGLPTIKLRPKREVAKLYSIFFFSSRRRHTRCSRDWSSDVCSSDLFVGGVKLPLALAELGLIDEYEFVVQPRLAGHGPTLFAGLSKRVDLRLVSRLEFGSGAGAMRDRKSTRLNSSHRYISYAAVCLKKNKCRGLRGSESPETRRTPPAPHFHITLPVPTILYQPGPTHRILCVVGDGHLVPCVFI